MSDDVRDYFEEFDYALEWDETPLGHITGRVWEAEVEGAGLYVVKRIHGTTVEGHFEPDPNSFLPASRSKTFNFWIEGADHYKKDKEQGWIKAEDAEHVCRLWCEQHAMDNKLIEDVRPKKSRPIVDPDELEAARQKLAKQLGINLDDPAE